MPKIILLDLNLPKVDGKEALRRIKSDERTKSIPVVIMSSSQQETDVAECFKLGASHYVVKAVGFEKLSEAVKQLKQY